MKRVARTVLISAVVITAVTAALAVAETGQYPRARQIPTVRSSERASVPSTTTSGVVAAQVATVPPAPVVKAAKPKAKAKTKARAKSSSSAKKAVKKTAPAPRASTKDDHDSDREVVKRRVRDESDDHDSDRESSD